MKRTRSDQRSIRASWRLNPNLLQLARHSRDPIVRGVEGTISEFSFNPVLGKRFDWKYLEDEEFVRKQQLLKEPLMHNRLLLSHFVRVVEAFEVVSIWRVADLTSCCVRSLNAQEVISACTIARAMIELSTRYGDVANFLYSYFKQLPWAKMSSEILILRILKNPSNPNDVETLEAYIERLIHGTRLKAALEGAEQMQQANVLTTIANIDKKLVKQNLGYTIMPHYEILCEVAHPNRLGFERYAAGVSKRDDGWQVRRMEEKATSDPSIFLNEECLWAISFSLGTTSGCFKLFQEIKAMSITHLGKPLP